MSILESCLRADLCSSPNMGIMLQGPSHSGKTSIAMDFACSLASSPPSSSLLSSTDPNPLCGTCGLGYRYLTPPIGAPNGADHALSTCCTCPAVVFVAPRRQKHRAVPFPLRCRPVDTPQHTSLRRPSKDFGGGERRWETECPANTAVMLERIVVKYMETRRELAMFLATVHSFSNDKKPWGGIVVDDLDWFIRDGDEDGVGGDQGGAMSSHSVKCATSSECMRLVQILAQLADAQTHLSSPQTPPPEINLPS